MRICINESTLKQYNIPLENILVLIAAARDISLTDAASSLTSDGMISKFGQQGNWKITAKGAELLTSVLIDSEESPISDEKLIGLATTLKSLFPKGIKPGTNYYWAEGVSLIVKRLKIFFKKYGNNFSEEDIISATKRYIESFNGDYRYMKLLKYFIFKDKRGDGGEVEYDSDLLTYLENKEELSEANSNWTSDLI